MQRNTNSDKFFTPAEQELIQSAVEKAEQATSSEIKLIVLRHCWQDIKVKANQLFKKHKLHETKQRNAVLILLVTTNREFLIYGDEGIHEKVGQSFWDDVKETMLLHFHQNEYGAGLQVGIERIGEKLKYFFPCQTDDKNEIGNEISYEE
ncbi:MAG: TPM domain-containing protein [Planctomycetes bacterium]|nr:TPM domain-containing protein [Planctomycetota bacterium]